MRAILVPGPPVPKQVPQPSPTWLVSQALGREELSEANQLAGPDCGDKKEAPRSGQINSPEQKVLLWELNCDFHFYLVGILQQGPLSPAVFLKQN